MEHEKCLHLSALAKASTFSDRLQIDRDPENDRWRLYILHNKSPLYQQQSGWWFRTFACIFMSVRFFVCYELGQCKIIFLVSARMGFRQRMKNFHYSLLLKETLGKIRIIRFIKINCFRVQQSQLKILVLPKDSPAN